MFPSRTAVALLLAGAGSLAGCQKQSTPATPGGGARGNVRTIEMSVTENGYEPANLTVKKGQPLRLLITRKTDETCARELIIADTGLRAELPLGQTVAVDWTPQTTGAVKYGCAMDMMISGVLLVE